MDDYKDNGRWTTRRTMGQQQGLWTPTRTTHKERRQLLGQQTMDNKDDDG